MDNADQNRLEDEIQRLRHALDAETRRSLDAERQLNRANADFEEFVSRAAHDLREPLRDVASLSQLLAETYGGRLDSEATGFLERIQAGTARMQSLLADVVDYWSTSSVDRQPSRTDLEAVLREALLLTNQQIAERSASVTHDPLPVVMGDLAILTKVLCHLIRNAIEYCEKPDPSVHISCRREDSEWVVSVRDNGPGVEPAFQDRIFGAFRRLHGREFPGTGLGLAFCKKAIERYGGRMWVESAPGEGATFFFTLPAT